MPFESTPSVGNDPETPPPRSIDVNADLQRLTVGHDWPGSRLTFGDMTELRRLSNLTRRPSNQLIKEAVEHYAACILSELEAVNARSEP